MLILVAAIIFTTYYLSKQSILSKLEDPDTIEPTLWGRYKGNIIAGMLIVIGISCLVAIQNPSRYNFGISSISLDFIMIFEVAPFVLLPFGVILFNKGYEYSQADIPPASYKGKTLVVLLVVSLVLFFGADRYHKNAYLNYQEYLAPYIETIDGQGISTEIDYNDYTPFASGNKTVTYNEPSTLTISESHPRLDGATALYPIYSAYVQTAYTNLSSSDVNSIIQCNKTPTAYDRLLGGDTDVIFVLEPSERHLTLAEDLDTELILTPIGKEAFVFFVNEKNTIDNLSVEEIQNIYTKEITNWKDVDGKNDKILPFQRPDNSGSQTIMLSQVMKDKQISKPLIREEMFGMGDIVSHTAEYANHNNALGYSFRFYATEMNANQGIKLLSVNGIKPTKENINNDTYPFTVDFYAVTTKQGSENPHTQEFIDWVLSPQGQKILELSGYTPRN